MMQSPIILPVETRRAQRQVAWTLARAFHDDPAMVWVLPDPGERVRVLPRFFGVMIEQSLRHGYVSATETCGAGALWYPPGEVVDRKRTRWWDDLRFSGLFKLALPRGMNVAKAMQAHHPDPQPYHYLRYVGVAPGSQGKGLGGAIIRDGIARAASQGCGVLLETATQSNVAIYQRLGFEVSAEWRVPEGGPKFWTMIHPAP